MMVAQKARDLPEGADIADLALEVARAERSGEQADDFDGVTFTTIHGAKGREWGTVFLVGFEEEAIPGTAASADVEEERRVAFVGITRARNSVYFSHAASRRATWGNRPIQPRRPSRFIAEALPL